MEKNQKMTAPERKLIIIMMLVMSALFCALQVKVHDSRGGLEGGRLAGPDAYMWLNRVHYLHESGTWRNHNYPRINPPEGHEQHWTRPFDALLYSGGLVGSTLTDFKTALHVWGTLISLILGIIALFAVLWLSLHPQVQDRASALAIAGLVFLTQISIFHAFSAGRPDHQSLLLCLLAVLLVLQAKQQRSNGREQDHLSIASGIVVAVSLWVSMESMLVAIIAQLAYGINWLRSDRSQARQALLFSMTLVVVTALVIATEYGTGLFFEPIYDRLSIVHVFLFCLTSAFWLFTYRFGACLQSIVRKLQVTLVAAFLIIASLWAVYPNFFDGPLASVDEFYRINRLQKIEEIQPMISINQLAGPSRAANLARLIAYLGTAIFSLLFGLYLLANKNSQDKKVWTFQVIGLLVFVPLTLMQVRWAGYAAMLSIPLYTRLCLAVRNACGHSQKHPATLRVASTVALLTWMLFPALLLPQPQPATIADSCDIRQLQISLANSKKMIPDAAKIMAHADFGPEILYRTNLSVFSIPNHRYQPGFRLFYDFLHAPDPETAYQIAKNNDFDLLFICGIEIETNSFSKPSAKNDFIHQIRQGSYPRWLQPLNASGQDQTQSLLFRVDTKVH